MNRLYFIAFIGLSLSADTVLAADPAPAQPAKGYRIIFRNTSGQISLPDDPRFKACFIDLTKAGMNPNERFGGPTRDRFRVVAYQGNLVPPTLICEEVATKRLIILELGKVVDADAKPKF
jgi:hypothetical protein